MLCSQLVLHPHSGHKHNNMNEAFKTIIRSWLLPVNIRLCAARCVVNHLFSLGVFLSGAARLVGSSTSGSGRVEVYLNGQWGAVCDSHWSDRDASVICRQLGLGWEETNTSSFRIDVSPPLFIFIYTHVLLLLSTATSARRCSRRSSAPAPASSTTSAWVAAATRTRSAYAGAGRSSPATVAMETRPQWCARHRKVSVTSTVSWQPDLNISPSTHLRDSQRFIKTTLCGICYPLNNNSHANNLTQ